jgi:hypothetical protein
MMVADASAQSEMILLVIVAELTSKKRFSETLPKGCLFMQCRVSPDVRAAVLR